MGHVKLTCAFEHVCNMHIQIILCIYNIWVFALHSYILLYPMILLADSEGTDQADAQSDLCLHCPHLPKDTFSHGETHM